MVVLPAASRPTISSRTSRRPHRRRIDSALEANDCALEAMACSSRAIDCVALLKHCTLRSGGSSAEGASGIGGSCFVLAIVCFTWVRDVIRTLADAIPRDDQSEHSEGTRV